MSMGYLSLVFFLASASTLAGATWAVTSRFDLAVMVFSGVSFTFMGYLALLGFLFNHAVVELKKAHELTEEKEKEEGEVLVNLSEANNRWNKIAIGVEGDEIPAGREHFKPSQ